MKRVICVALMLVAAHVPRVGTAASAAFKTLLSQDIRPLHYALTLEPDAAALRFKGLVAIDLQVLTPTRTVMLNSLGLDLESAAVDGHAADIRVDAPAQTATFQLPTTLSKGHHRLLITYRGPISTQATGLYALDYKDAAGESRRALYTQFEPSDARRMFPSFDEPSLKATFSIDAVVPEGQLAVSNMLLKTALPPLLATYAFDLRLHRGWLLT